VSALPLRSRLRHDARLTNLNRNPIMTMYRTAKITILSLLTVLVGHSGAAELPASLTGLKKVKTSENKDGRTVHRYEHGKNNYFYVLPCKGVENPPLRVVLHHAGGSGDRALNEAYSKKHRHQYADDNFAVLYLDCRNEQKTGGWWWGWHQINKKKDTYKTMLNPTEQRVLDTVEWVIKDQNIDRDRVYLSGRSMGGTGSLGIGYCRGDIFAAILVNVPAGAEHFLFRMSNSDYPDPPPTINTSSQTDGWSKKQEDLLAFCQANKLPMTFAWGPFGHASKPDMANSAVYDFPWESIVRNAAYPVFTNADSDDTYPGHKNTSAKDQKGQINAYFRWTNVTDTAAKFEMELRLVKQDELGKPADIPAASTADLTLRRLQAFAPKTGKTYAWKTTRDGKTLQSGNVVTDAKGLLTIPAVKVEAAPAILVIE
jgi:poly(3-hydroxybutyrate) depolymerase